MLSQIPGVGTAAAIAIMKEYKYISNLIADLQEHGEECLKKIRICSITELQHKERRLTKTCIENLIKYLI